MVPGTDEASQIDQLRTEAASTATEANDATRSTATHAARLRRTLAQDGETATETAAVATERDVQ